MSTIDNVKGYALTFAMSLLNPELAAQVLAEKEELEKKTAKNNAEAERILKEIELKKEALEMLKKHAELSERTARNKERLEKLKAKARELYGKE